MREMILMVHTWKYPLISSGCGFIKNGTCLVDTPVVTGNPNKGHGTPKGGVWRLKDKASPFTLVGKKPDGSIDYEEPVNYWMPFNGGIGLHDAFLEKQVWRNALSDRRQPRLHQSSSPKGSGAV